MRSRPHRHFLIRLQIGALFVGAPIFGAMAFAQPRPSPPMAAPRVAAPPLAPAKTSVFARQLVGNCPGVAVLEVSPDGKWLLGWDGVTRRNPKNPFGPRWVWNLTTGQSRNFRRWSPSQMLDNQKCGWTPDGRLFSLQIPVSDGLSPAAPRAAPRVFLQNPDGSQKIVGYDPPRAGEIIESESPTADVQFSSDGREFWLLSRHYWRRFDGRTGKLREWRPVRPVSGPLSLSRDGQQILAHNQWKIFDARTGRLLLHIAHQNGEKLLGFGDDGQYRKQKSGFQVFCRLSDDKMLWQIPQSAQLVRGDGLSFVVASEKTLVQFDKSNGETGRTLPKLKGKWVALAISRDASWIYAVNGAGQIYRWKPFKS